MNMKREPRKTKPPAKPDLLAMPALPLDAMRAAITKRLDAAEAELREMGAWDNPGTAVMGGAVRELVYELRRLVR